MPDDPNDTANSFRKLPQDRHTIPISLGTASSAAGMAPESKYFALSPTGIRVEIPKELFVALSDFLETRKYAGEIKIEFRSGEIISVEAVSKKRYR